MSNTIDRWKTDPECIALADFLVEQTKQVKSPMNLRKLIGDFKEKTGSTQRNSCLRDRIVSFRENVVEMADMDADTKIRLMFALSLPVDYGLLQELEKDAEVALDSYKRITEYKRKGGGLHLTGKHHVAGFKSNQKDVRILDFLAEKSKKAINPISDQPILKEFITKSGVSEWLQTLEKRYRKLKKQIYELSSYDMKTKIRMIFVSGTKVSNYALEEIRREAIVEVDQYNRITKYEAKDGSLLLEGEHSVSYKRKTAHAKNWQKALGNGATDDSDEDEERQNDVKDKESYQNNLADLVKFVGEKCMNTNHPLSISRLCNQYKQIKKSSESMQCLVKRVLSYKEKISTVDHLDVNSRVRQCFGLSVSLDPEYLKEIRKDSTVEVDQYNRITKYEAKDGSLLLEGEHSHSYKRKTAHAKNWRKALGNEDTDDSDEDEESQNNAENNQNYQNDLADLVKFFVEKCLKTDRPLPIERLCKEYKQIKKSSGSMQCLGKRVLRYRERISTIDHLDVNSKVRQLFGLSVPLDSEYLKELRKTAIVEVDEKQRIIRYEANDGSLQLQGDHSRSAKCALGWAEIRKRKSTPQASNASDDTEDEETSSDSEETDGETTRVNRKLTNAAKKGRNVLTRSSDLNSERKKANESLNQSSLKKRTKLTVLDDMSDEEESEVNDVIDTPDMTDPRSELDMDYDNDRMLQREDAVNDSEVPESSSSDESDDDEGFHPAIISESNRKGDISELQRIKNTENRVPVFTSRRRKSVRIASMESTVIDKSKDIQDTIHCQSDQDLNMSSCRKIPRKDVNDPEESESSSSDDSDDDDENYTPGKKLILCETKRRRRCNTPRREVNITQNEVEIGRTRRTASVRPLLSSKTSKGKADKNSRSEAVPDDSFDDFIPNQCHFDRNTDVDDTVLREDPKAEKSVMNRSGRPTSSDMLIANKNSDVEHQILTGTDTRNNTEIEPIKKRNPSNQVSARVTKRRVSVRIAAINSVNLDNKTVVNSKKIDSIKVPDPENNNARMKQRKDPASNSYDDESVILDKEDNTWKVGRVRRSNTPRRGVNITQNDVESGRKRKNITAETPSLTKKSKESLIVNGISEAEPERQQDFGLDAGVTSGCSNPKESQMSAIEDPNVEKESIDNHVPPPEVPSNEDSTNSSTSNVIPKEQIPLKIQLAKILMMMIFKLLNRREDHVSHHKLLNAFRVMLRALDLSVLARLQQTIEKKLKNDRNSNELVPVKGILLGLESCLHVLMKSAIMKPEGTSTSLNNVLLHLRSAVILIDSPTLNDFEQRLKEEIAKFSVKDMYIPVNVLQNSLNMAVYIFAPTKIP